MTYWEELKGAIFYDLDLKTNVQNNCENVKIRKRDNKRVKWKKNKKKKKGYESPTM